MRKTAKAGRLSVHVTIGTHSALLGFDFATTGSEKWPRGLLGFGIERTDHTENDMRPLRGGLTFKETYSVTSNYSVYDHCIQGFRWGDYTVKPGHDYTYKVFPVYGEPKNLKPGDSVSVKVRAEVESEGTHGIHFNRGTSAIQSFSHRYGHVPLDDLEKAMSKANFMQTPEALEEARRKIAEKKGKAAADLSADADSAAEWLSRGLCRAIIGFIENTEKDERLLGCLYEYTYRPIFDAILRAISRGVDVQLIVDDRSAAGGNYAAMKTTRKYQTPWDKRTIHRDASGISISVISPLA